MEGDNRELFYLDAVIHHEMTPEEREKELEEASSPPRLSFTNNITQNFKKVNNDIKREKKLVGSNPQASRNARKASAKF